MLKVKPFQQKLNRGYCGPAALKILLSYYGMKKTEKELAKMTGWSRELGVSKKGIKNAAEQLGFKVKIKRNSNFKDIEKWLSKGVPVIVDWFTRGGKNYDDCNIAVGHYSVVMGLDKKFIYLQDPEIGKVRRLEREDFMKVWFDFTGKYIKPWELVIRQIIAIYK
jgi:predicted double-glycine peptidase